MLHVYLVYNCMKIKEMFIFTPNNKFSFCLQCFEMTQKSIRQQVNSAYFWNFENSPILSTFTLVTLWPCSNIFDVARVI